MAKRFVFSLLACCMLAAKATAQSPMAQQWTGTWACSPQYAGKDNMPKNSDLGNSSLRQIVHVSIGGQVVRLQLSNEYGAEPVEIKSVYVATAKDSFAIDAKTARYLTFHGNKGTTIGAGKALFSDAVQFDLKPLQRLAITINYGKTSKIATSHNGSRTTSYILKGESKPKTDFSNSTREDHWYNIAALDVFGIGNSCIAVLGNSITDGRGSTTNKQNRWTDVFVEHLHYGNPSVGVLNQGIGGNCVLAGGLGDPALKRFGRDIMAQRGLSAVIIFEGVNDLGGSKDAVQTVMQLIKAYKGFIKDAKAKGLKVYGATITPFNGHYYYSRDHEMGRQMVNLWIRESGKFDGVLDFDLLMRDPQDPSRLQEAMQEDWLHPNALGYKAMGEYAARLFREKFVETK